MSHYKMSNSDIKIAPELPSSCVRWIDAFIGLFAVLGAYYYCRDQTTFSNPQFAAFLIGVNALVMCVIELCRAPWRKQIPSQEGMAVWGKRASIKLLGFFFFCSVIVFFYWLFPEYSRPFYNGFFDVGSSLIPWASLTMVAYFYYVEWRVPSVMDGGHCAGLFVMGKWGDVDWIKLRNYALGWLVKGYFLPIMFSDAAATLLHYRLISWDFTTLTFEQGFNLVFYTCVGIELIFVAAGYLFSSRLFDSHIRSVETTLYGWVVAIVSYGPFLSFFYTRYLSYRGETTWLSWLQDNQPMAIMWGITILVFMAIHMWCDACFGIRFSNLTNRGIITNGPYRFSKHPAYVIKNIRWWMVSVPFAVQGWVEALRLSLLCVGVNILYTFRAIAEEKLLSQDPKYISYALWMDKNGILRFLGKIAPFMTYEWRLRRWLKSGEVLVKPADYFA